MRQNQALGKMGENIAQEYLTSQGYEIIDRNYYTRYGEIDLIAYQFHENNIHDKELVFIEVKTRRTRTFGFPEESIGTKKRAALLASSLTYLQEHPEIGEDWRIDVIAISYIENKVKPDVLHFINAIINE